MKTFTDRQSSRIAFWLLHDPQSNAENARHINANIKAGFYGREMPYPDALPTQDEAREMLREFVATCRKLDSRYSGDCNLTDARFSPGTPIYYRKAGDRTHTIIASEADEFLAVTQ